MLPPAFRAVFVLERLQKRQDKKCSKILELGGGEAFSAMSKKSSKRQANWTKSLGTGKELDLGLTGTALKPFFGLRQGFQSKKTCRSIAKTA